MRLPLLIAAVLTLAACGKNDQSGTALNADQGLTAESIVSNDVTAIDAVTGDAANMAADVDTNYGNLDQDVSEESGNAPTPKTATRSRTAPKSLPTPTTNTTATANTATNAE